jgi:hypothetical protein
VCIYICKLCRLQLQNLPLPQKEIQDILFTQSMHFPKKVETMIIIFDLRVDNEDVLESNKTLLWNSEYTRRLVHLAAQTHTVFYSSFVPTFKTKEFTLIYFLPFFFSFFIENCITKANKQLRRYYSDYICNSAQIYKNCLKDCTQPKVRTVSSDLFKTKTDFQLKNKKNSPTKPWCISLEQKYFASRSFDKSVEVFVQSYPTYKKQLRSTKKGNAF